MGFNPLQGRKPKAADLAIFAASLAAVIVAVLWGVGVF
jgi:hypothetical protein